MPHDIQSLAYHEAGHAVVARYFGRKLIAVHIHPNGHSGGSTSTGHGLDARQDGLVAFAGRVAEMLAGHAVVDDPDRGVGWLGDEIDIHQAVREKTGLDIDDDGFRDACDALEEETQELIQYPPIWSAVDALAAVLVEQHVVDGAAAMSIIDPILRGVPVHS
jgi:hypothetical protein